MNESEIWNTIVGCTLRQDWVGVGVMADALAELGLESEAEGVRWVARQTIRIHHWNFRSSGGEDYWYGTIRLPDGVEPFSWSFRADSCRLWYAAVDQRRKQMQEFLK